MAVQVDANQALIERYREVVERGDMRELMRFQDEVISDDYVQEWPQSGERIRGRDNLRGINEQYGDATGTSPKFTIRDVRGSGNLYVTQGTIDYGDGTPVSYVGIAELENGKIRRMTEYFANPFEAPEWRAKYVERM